MNTLIQDMKYGLRMLVKNKGFSIVAILTLALGIGANTAIFSVINALLLRPLPFNEPERIVAIRSADLSTEGGFGSISYPDFFDWQAQAQTIEKMAAYDSKSFTLYSDTESVRLSGATVSSDLFSILGVNPEIGRPFSAEEDKKGGGRVLILSHDLWQTRYGSDPNIFGKTVSLNQTSYTIVGVMPASFRFPLDEDPVDFWTNVTGDAEFPPKEPLTSQRGNHFLQAVGRLQPGATIEQADAELKAISATLAQQYPDSNTNFSAKVMSLSQQLYGDVRPSLIVLFAAVGCVLLIACANVANLLLARATARRREIAVRTALGASRWRVVRQLLTESVMLAIVGGAAGLLLASFGTDLLIAITPTDIPRIAETSVDSRVLLFTLSVATITGLVMGIIPAINASRLDLNEMLKEGGRGSAGGRRGSIRGALVVAEVAVAVTLLVGAGLLAQSFVRLMKVDSGFNPDNVLTVRAGLPGGLYETPEQITTFHERLLERIGTLPGIVSYSTVAPLPLSRNNVGVGFSVEGRANPTGRPFPYETALRLVGPDYFSTMGTPIKQGRGVTERDRLGQPNVIVINESLARQYFADEDPIGKRINPSMSIDESGPAMREIVGVVADTRPKGPGVAPEPEVYVPISQLPAVGSITLLIRTNSNPTNLIAAVRQEIASIDSKVPVYEVRMLNEYFSETVAQPRFNSLLSGIFAALALLLTGIGLYGVISYSVSQSTQEIGVRMALGAQPRDVLRLIIKKGMLLTLIGLALGLTVAFPMTRFMESLLYGVTATDTVTFATVSVVLAAVALLACWIPARRATRIDPMVALRYE